MSVDTTEIIVVNDIDEEVGSGEKLRVHQQGLLHRAFSVLIFNDNNELLIHQRVFNKYHSGGLWTNTCCGHPNVNESIKTAAERRLGEEMGFTCNLDFLYKFHYKTTFDNQLTENEIDHVFTGVYNNTFEVNPAEVLDYKWVSVANIVEAIANNPQNYTFWFKKIIQSEAFQEFVATNHVLS
ncbi:isopentenyl-diphosphate Delta-isomerase [Emticicia sp. BO119]|uniref:isopentenyl-diphosphate Delta-isomerase n=1 Tax=Emticicia sp. BO119 TaxID=2757768 RepID=UPI0015F00F75|nr:isopentenyl-diphosphate Delta-isomerase [Emticicia sp. BO119]MBA4851544.1 isopentenyl-diphosphate Delta-isomerase [Emticicia sp. BO119]